MLPSGLEAEHGDLLAFLNAAPVGLLKLSLDGRIELINAVSAKLLLPLTGRRRLDNLFDVLAGVAPGLRQRVAQAGPAYGPLCGDLRLRVVPADGPTSAERWLCLQLTRLSASHLLGVLTDITDQVLAEQALQASQQQLQFALDAVQLGDWVLDLASGLISASARFDRCLGFGTDAPPWTLERLLQQLHADDREEIRRALQSVGPRPGPWHAECRVCWPDGSVHWIALHGHVQTDEGRAQRLLGIVIDATALREAEQSRRRARALEAENRQIQAASHFKSQLLGTLSHEFRTPLNAIIGFADLLGRDRVGDDRAKRSGFVSHIASSGRQLLRLVEDMLDLAASESRGFVFKPETVALAPLVHEVVEALAAQALRQGVDLQTDIDPALPPLHLDPLRLKQVLLNYLSNAIRFSPRGGPVVLRARAHGDAQLRIEVEDRGIGIAEADLPRLFTEFGQLDTGDRRQHDGAGLGLALVRRLVEAQGGQVGVRSVPGQGSVFHLVLDRVQGAARPPAAAAAAR